MINENEIPFNQTSILMAIILLTTTIAGYVKIENGVPSSYIVMGGVVFLLFCFTVIFIVYMIKIKNKTATDMHMGSIRIIPIFGWIYSHSSLYQRMAKKLVSDEAVQGCKNALENMKHNGIYRFEKEWINFCKYFTKIDASDKNQKIIHSLALGVLNAKIENETDIARVHLDNKMIIIRNTKTLKDMNLANFLKEKLRYELSLIQERDHKYEEDEVTEEALQKEIAKRTSWLNKLKEELVEENTDLTFKEMCKIQN